MLTCDRRDSLSPRMNRLVGATLTVALAALSLAQPVRAQGVAASVAPGSSSDAGILGEDADPRLRDRRADELIESARELTTTQGWAEAASLYEEAAELRAPADPRAVEELTEAANLYAFADDRRRAVDLLQTAGERAEEMGDVFRAAQSFQQAAALNANIIGVRYRTTSLWERVCALSESPRLTENQRETLLQRVPPCR